MAICRHADSGLITENNFIIDLRSQQIVVFFFTIFQKHLMKNNSFELTKVQENAILFPVWIVSISGSAT